MTLNNSDVSLLRNPRQEASSMIQTLKRESSRDAIKTNGTENNQNIAGGQSSKNNDGINTSVHGSIHIGTETVLNSKYKDVRKGEMH